MASIKPGFPCACCGFLTLSDDSHETFEICPVCNWEDDDAQFNNPTLRGGANQENLIEARNNFKAYGAAAPRFKKEVRPPLPNEIP